ncbi:hypothetical protein KC324_g63 [Hortaea werneckii]|nr:hypothetical protein KC324_g63 [Hortaea werneckii]
MTLLISFSSSALPLFSFSDTASSKCWRTSEPQNSSGSEDVDVASTMVSKPAQDDNSIWRQLMIRVVRSSSTSATLFEYRKKLRESF